MITITTEQVTKTNGVYNLEVTKEDNEIVAVKAVVTAQIHKENGLGGYILSAKVGTIEQNGKGTSITGEIPSDVLPDVISEFNEIVNNLNNN